MRRINDNTIEITQEELTTLECFIDNSLHNTWDRYTDYHICTKSWEEGKKSMNPELYTMAAQMREI